MNQSNTERRNSIEEERIHYHEYCCRRNIGNKNLYGRDCKVEKATLSIGTDWTRLRKFLYQ